MWARKLLGAGAILHDVRPWFVLYHSDERLPENRVYGSRIVFHGGTITRTDHLPRDRSVTSRSGLLPAQEPSPTIPRASA